jgi:CubicO group peptidase (beta-lactamase class C family)
MWKHAAVGFVLLAALGCSDDTETQVQSGGAGGAGGGGFAAFAGIAAVGGSGGGGDTGGTGDIPLPPPDDHHVVSRFNTIDRAIAKRLEALPDVGAAFAIIEDGKVAWSKGYGRKDPRNVLSKPVTSETLFVNSAVSQVATTIRIMQMVEDGLLSVEDLVPDQLREMRLPYMNRHPDWLGQMRVRHLMSMTSGLKSSHEPADVWCTGDEAALERYMTRWAFKFGWMEYPPGRLDNYSGDDFRTLGLLIERLDKRSYRESIGLNVLRPLGMAKTFFRPEELIAHGNVAVNDGLIDPCTLSPMNWPTSSSLTTVRNLAKLGLFLMEGNELVLSDAGLARLNAPHIATGSHTAINLSSVRSVVGLQRANDDIQTYPFLTLSFGGDVGDYSSSVILVPSLGIGYVRLTNQKLPAEIWDDGAIVETALRSLAKLPPAPMLGEKEDPVNLNRYVGTYRRLNELITITRGLRAGLHVKGHGLDCNLTPGCPCVFHCTLESPDRPTEIKFFKDADGNPEFLRLNSVLVAQRMRLIVPPFVE